MSADWLALIVQDLPLEWALGSLEPGPRGLIVVSSGARPQVLSADAIARDAGVHPGLSQQAALSLSGGLDIAVYAQAQGEALMRSIGSALFRFSPKQWRVQPAELLIEIEGSARLFGGSDALQSAILATVHRLGVRITSATATAPYAALVLARSGMADLAQAPVQALGLGRAEISALERIGLKNIQALRALPRAELARRIDPQVVAALDLLNGGVDPGWVALKQPEQIQTRLDLAHPAHQFDALQFALKRACEQIATALNSRQLGALALVLRLRHEGQKSSDYRLSFSTPQGDSSQLMAALKLKLADSVLRAEVLAIALIAAQTGALAPQTGDLFARADHAKSERAPVLDRLRARLGDAAVQQPALSADHRLRVSHRLLAGEPPAGPRPLLLSARPERIAIESVERVLGPERIESGWWDGFDQARDYWVAKRADGTLLLIWQDLRAPECWWVEGYFD